jgi:predicted metal-dependent peptidase
MAKDTAEARILRARVKLLLDQPFFGNLLLYLEPVEKKNMSIRTMATDGDHLYFDPDFVMNLPESQLVGVMVHEVGHIALRHLARRQGRHPLKWNFAADFAVNDLIINTLKSSGERMFELPRGVLINPAWHDQSAEQIYSQLPDSKGGVKGGDGHGGKGEQDGIPDLSGKKTLDSHDEWESWDKKGSGESQEQAWKDRLARAAVDARTRGKLPGGWQTVLDDFLQPKLDWKSILLDTIVSNSRNDYRLFPPNKKHIWRGFYLPSLRGEEINIAMGIDVSGSISDEEIREALSEVHGICQQFSDFSIHLFTFDTHITGKWELHPFDEVPKVVSGRGGTDFDDVCREAEKLPVSTLIIFSDLCAPFPPEPKIPTIWLSVGDAKPPWGILLNYPRK